MAAAPVQFPLSFFNGSLLPLKVSYKYRIDPGSTANIGTHWVTIDPETTKVLEGGTFNTDDPIRILIQPATTTLSNNVVWDSGSNPDPDGVVVRVEPKDFVDAATKPFEESGTQGLFEYTYQLGTGVDPTTKEPLPLNAGLYLHFTAKLICEQWYTACPTIMGKAVAECSGFQSTTGRTVCEAFCSHPDNVGYCDAMKNRMCSAQAGDHYKTSPECICIAKWESQVALPSTLDMTYAEFHDLVNKATSLNLSSKPDVCWYPGCQDQALLTSSMKAEAASETCKTATEQICVNSIGNINMQGGSGNVINLLNCCGQTVAAGQPWSPSDYMPNNGPGSGPGTGPTSGPGTWPVIPSGGPGPGPSPGPGPAPAPAPASGLSTFAIVGIVAGVIVLIVIIIAVAFALKKS